MMFNWSPNRKVSLTFTKLNLGHLLRVCFQLVSNSQFLNCWTLLGYVTLRIPGKFVLPGPSKLPEILTLMAATRPGSFGTLAHYFTLFWITTFLRGSSSRYGGGAQDGWFPSFLPEGRAGRLLIPLCNPRSRSMPAATAGESFPRVDGVWLGFHSLRLPHSSVPQHRLWGITVIQVGKIPTHTLPSYTKQSLAVPWRLKQPLPNCSVINVSLLFGPPCIFIKLVLFEALC